MKRNFIIFLLIFMSYESHCAFPFKVERLAFHLNEIAFNDKCIIAYGTNSIIMRSENLGKDWEQILVDSNDLNISKIIWTGEKYVGILSDGTFITSNEDAKNWGLIRNSEKAVFNDLTEYEDKLFALTDSSIMIYSNSFELIKTIPITTSTKAGDIEYSNGFLFVSADSGKVIRYDINKDYESKTIDFHELSICTNCSNPTKLKIYNDKLYLYIGVKLYASEDNGLSWTKLDNYSNTYSVRNNELYLLVSNYDFKNKVSKIYFFQNIDTVRNKINNDPVQRFLDISHYNSMEFISDDTIIVVANDKFIMMSYNRGVDWQYISNIAVNTYQSNWLSEKIGFAINDDGRIFKTSDGGVTFLPQIYNQSGYLNILGYLNSYFDSTGAGIVNFYSTNNKANVLKSKDFGENFEHFAVADINKFCDASSGFIKSPNGYTYIQADRFNSDYLTRVYIFEDRMIRKNFKLYDSLNIISYRKINDEGKYEGIGWENKGYRAKQTFDSVSYYLMNSSDYGFTWEKTHKFKLPHYYKNCTYIDGKYFIITGIYDSLLNIHTFLNVFDAKTNFLQDSIYLGLNNNFWPIKMQNNFIILTFNNLIYSSNIYDKSENWQIDSVAYWAFNKCSWNNDSIAYLFTYDSLYKYGFLTKLTLNESLLGVDYKLEEIYFYSEKPYPLPASSKISCKVYWDYRFIPSLAKLELYNYKGELILGDGRLSLESNEVFSGKIIWDCSFYKEGIYFIVLSQNNTKKVIPVIVSR